MSLTNALLIIFALMVAVSVISSLTGVGRPLLVTVVGTSMYPTLIPLDIVFVNPVPTIINEGDIIIYKHGGIPIIHRVVKVTEEGYITKGDANPAPDPWIVKKEEVLGKAIAVKGFVFKVNALPLAVTVVGLDLMRKRARRTRGA